MIPLIDTLLVARRERNRKRELDLAPCQLSRELEPDRTEDPQHVAVVGKDLRDDPFDSLSSGERGELLDEPGADTPSLVRIRNREGCFRDRRIAQPLVVGDRDDAFCAVLEKRTEK